MKTGYLAGMWLGLAMGVLHAETVAMKAMTFNLRYENQEDAKGNRWRQRVVPIVQMIRESGFDYFGVQEGMHGQMADLWGSMPEYRLVGVGRDDGKQAGEYAGIFYHSGRWMEVEGDRGYLWLSGEPERAGSKTWGNAYPRMLTWVRLKHRKTGKECYVYNTHWDHEHQESRVKSAKMIRQVIENRKDKTIPVVLLGDLNAVEKNPAVRMLTEGGGKDGLVDVYRQMHPKEGPRVTLHFWAGKKGVPIRVDYIFASPGVAVKAARIRDEDERLLSDHFPVVAELELR